jgi:hypothetical protein
MLWRGVVCAARAARAPSPTRNQPLPEMVFLNTTTAAMEARCFSLCVRACCGSNAAPWSGAWCATAEVLFVQHAAIVPQNSALPHAAHQVRVAAAVRVRLAACWPHQRARCLAAAGATCAYLRHGGLHAALQHTSTTGSSQACQQAIVRLPVWVRHACRTRMRALTRSTMPFG